ATASSCCVLPPLQNCLLEAPPSTRSDRHRSLNRGYEPPGAHRARHFDCTATTRCDDFAATSWGMSIHLRWRSGRPRADGGARPSRGASELRDLTPPARSPATVGSRAGGLAPRIRAVHIAERMPIAAAFGS